MKCDEVRKRLDEYLDGELSTEEAAAVEEHLTACGACRAEHEALKQTVSLVRSLPKAEPPRDLSARIEASIGQQAALRKRAAVLRWARVGGWVAAAATLLIVIRYAPWGTERVREERGPAAPPTGSAPGGERLEEAAKEGAVLPEAPRDEAPTAGVAREALPAPSPAVETEDAPRDRPAFADDEGARSHGKVGPVLRKGAGKAGPRPTAPKAAPKGAADQVLGPPDSAGLGFSAANNKAAEGWLDKPVEWTLECDSFEAGLAAVEEAAEALDATIVETDDAENADPSRRDAEGAPGEVVLALPVDKLDDMREKLGLVPEPEDEGPDRAQEEVPAASRAAQFAQAEAAAEARQEARAAAERAAEADEAGSADEARREAAAGQRAAQFGAGEPTPRVAVRIIFRIKANAAQAGPAAEEEQ